MKVRQRAPLKLVVSRKERPAPKPLTATRIADTLEALLTKRAHLHDELEIVHAQIQLLLSGAAQSNKGKL